MTSSVPDKIRSNIISHTVDIHRYEAGLRKKILRMIDQLGQDLVSQLINHVGRRVEALRGSAQAIEGLRKVLEMNPDDPAAIHRVRDELVRLGEHLDTHEVSGKHNPVAQHALSHGDIELF